MLGFGREELLETRSESQRGICEIMRSGREGCDSKIDANEPDCDRDGWKGKYCSNELKDILDESKECVDDQNSDYENYAQDNRARDRERYVKIGGCENTDSKGYQRRPTYVAERAREEEYSENSHDNQVVLQVGIRSRLGRKSYSENAG